MTHETSRAERLNDLLKSNPDQPASTEFSTSELEAARALGPHNAVQKPLVAVTLREAAHWIAQAGKVDVAQRIDVTDSIALKRGLASVALYVGLTQGAPGHQTHRHLS